VGGVLASRLKIARQRPFEIASMLKRMARLRETSPRIRWRAHHRVVDDTLPAPHSANHHAAATRDSVHPVVFANACRGVGDRVRVESRAAREHAATALGKSCPDGILPAAIATHLPNALQ